MKDNQQIGQAIYKSKNLRNSKLIQFIVSEGKRKQLFNNLLHEFRNSKVNMATPNYVSGSHQGIH